MRGRSTSAQSAMQGGPLFQNLTIHKQLMVKPCSGEMEALVESAFSIHLPLLGQLEMPRLQPETICQNFEYGREYLRIHDLMVCMGTCRRVGED
jgi:hypothetical protein